MIIKQLEADLLPLETPTTQTSENTSIFTPTLGLLLILSIILIIFISYSIISSKTIRINQTINGISLKNYTIQFNLNITVENSIIPKSSAAPFIELYFTHNIKQYKIKFLLNNSNVSNEIGQWYKKNKKDITISSDEEIVNLNEDQQKEILNIILNNSKVRANILHKYLKVTKQLLELNQKILDNSIITENDKTQFILSETGIMDKIPKEEITTDLMKTTHNIWRNFYLELIEQVGQFKEDHAVANGMTKEQMKEKMQKQTEDGNWIRIIGIIESNFEESLDKQKPTK